MLASAFLSMYTYNFVISLTFTVTRASAETTPSLYYQSLIDFTLVIKVCTISFERPEASP